MYATLCLSEISTLEVCVCVFSNVHPEAQRFLLFNFFPPFRALLLLFIYLSISTPSQTDETHREEEREFFFFVQLVVVMSVSLPQMGNESSTSSFPCFSFFFFFEK